MRHLLPTLVTAMALTVASCDSPPSTTGTIVLEVELVGDWIGPDDYAVADITAWARQPCERSDAHRLVWRASEVGTISFPCDVGRNAAGRHGAFVEMRGLYPAEVDAGAIEAPLPEGTLPRVFTGDGATDVTCRAGETHSRRLVIDVGAVGTVTVSAQARVSDAAQVVWGLYGESATGAFGWARQVGDQPDGRVEYVASCASTAPASAEMTFGGRVAGAYGEVAPWNVHNPEPADPMDALCPGDSINISGLYIGGDRPIGSPPALEREVTCVPGEAVSVDLGTVTLAELVDDHVEIGGVRCDASWRCGTPGVSASAFELSCAPRDDAPAAVRALAPTIFADEAHIDCLQPGDERLSESFEITQDGGTGRATWRVETDVDRRYSSCRIGGRATVALAGDHTAIGEDGAVAADHVYPYVSFDLPVGTSWLACQDADTEHAIWSAYTVPGASTHFAHVWRQD